MVPVRRLLPVVGGPLLIVVSTLFRLREIILQGAVSSRNLDLLAAFFPWHCHLGRSLSAGTIPAWNPYTMGGAPFAADPQSGWMFLPAMAPYSMLPCTDAVTLFLVLHPVIGGLALYAFLRSEDASRPAATTGGLALALVLSRPRLLFAVPFVSALAWTAVLLAMASRFVRAERWPARLGWLVAAAFAWGQVAAAHMSHGLLIATAALGTYLFAALSRRRDAGLPRRRSLLGLLLLALPAVNLAVLLPRLGYLPSTSITLGYQELRDASSTPLLEHTLPFGWGDALLRPGRQYMGALVATLALAALFSPRWRRLALSFAALGAVAYLASVRGVAQVIAPVALRVPFGDVYLHAPRRLGLIVPVILAVLAGLAVDAWISARSQRSRWLMLSPVLLTVALPAIANTSPGPRLFLLALAACAVALMISARRPALALLLPIALAVEINAESLFGGPEPIVPDPVPAEWLDDRPPVLAAVGSIGAGRIITLGPNEIDQRFRASLWANVLHVEEAQGYNPVQPRRYWRFLRERNARPTEHNSAILLSPDPLAVDLFGVGWIVSAEAATYPGWEKSREAGSFTLHRRAAPPRAALVPISKVVGDEHAALRAITARTFDPAQLVILEEDPGLPSAGGPLDGEATFRWSGDGGATIAVDASRPALVLVRNSYDSRWRAEVKGQRVPVLRANYLLQAVPVPAGRHVISLTYRDPLIGYGLAGSLISILIAAAAAFRLRRRGSRRGSPASANPAADQAS